MNTQRAVEVLEALGYGQDTETQTNSWQLTDPETVREAAEKVEGDDRAALEAHAKWLEKTHKRVKNALNSKWPSTAKRVWLVLFESCGDGLLWTDELVELEEHLDYLGVDVENLFETYR